MSKSVLTIDTPEHCYLCTCYTEDEGDGYCLGITAKRVPTEGKPSWCPLRPYEESIPIEWILKRAKLCAEDYANCLHYTVEAWQTEQKYMVNGQWKFSKDGEKENGVEESTRNI